MKKIILAISILLLTACTNGNSALDKLKEDYPKTIKKEVEMLPENIQNEIAVPKRLPINVKNVSLDVQKNIGNDTINLTSINYRDGKGVIVEVTTYHQKNIEFSGEGQQLTTKLKDGTKVIIVRDDKDGSKIIRWKKDGLYHEIMLVKLTDIDQNYTIIDLVEIANSIYE
ncbi:hypothetical protein CN692_21105 [Bacillus sp. AFS002410]|uniref:hypothetical protein n=1 Tax=Bacillus sp. AFS002410 TaxID=2033481 RepID=UPI000BEF5CEA|nr:hypothetical protein [Bacillus sp. AFS002410]PEJ53809.1 hypothetical protein CN692_21105 [Bacillus sp. AFS002410]